MNIRLCDSIISLYTILVKFVGWANWFYKPQIYVI